MDRERRSAARVALDAHVRIRAAGSSGRGVPCRVVDAGAGGIRLSSEESVDSGWLRIEVLKASGRPTTSPLEARIVRMATAGEGRQEIGCRFE